MWRTAARVSSANASVSDGIGNRGIISLLHLASCGTCSRRPSPHRRPPGQDVCRSLRERGGRPPAPVGWRRARPSPAAPTATERHYKRPLLPTPLGTPPFLGERPHRNRILRS